MSGFNGVPAPNNGGEEIPACIQKIRDLQAQIDPTTASRVKTQVMHFTALMQKNILLKLRAPISAAVELLLPVIFASLLILVWAVSSKGDVEAEQYVTPPEVPDYDKLAMDALCVRADAAADVDGLSRCPAAATPAVCADFPSLPVKGLCSIPDPMAALGPLSVYRRPRAFLTLDGLIAAQWLAILGGERGGSGFRSGTLANSGYLYFAPANAVTRALVAEFNRTSKLFKYISEPDRNPAVTDAFIADHIESKDFDREGPGVMGVVVVKAWTADRFDVTYRFNGSSIPSTATTEELYVNGMGSYDGPKYAEAGFGTIQTMLARQYAKDFNLPVNATAATAWLGADASSPAASLAFTAMPNAKYEKNEFLTAIGSMAPLLLAFGYLYLVSQMTKKIVEEKETRMREAMKIMGLSTLSFYAAWIITYFVIVLIGAAIISLVLVVTVVPKANFVVVFLLFFLFAASNITLSSLIASFFSASRVAALVAPVLFFAMACPSFAVPKETSPTILMLLSIMSPSAFARGADLLFEHEKTDGASLATLADGDYPMLVVFIILGIDIVLYLALTLYLDAVLPSEWGTRSHPCFCFLASWCPWIRAREHNRGYNADGSVKDGKDPAGAYETVDRGMARPSVRMYGLRKEFDTPAGHFTAVNDLTMDMYEGEITVLLGHNGAGKTTAMNLMTGMLEMSAGDCIMYGSSVNNEIAAARQNIGMCPQHNILWDDLTCREHLRFFAKIKGLAGDALDEMVEAMLEAVDLVDKAEVKSAGLSGGQKRKLSVGIAFVGGSRMVFLDEPTAGMDVAARRFTWDLIKHMAHGRTILLTTHFMDEADLLGNTVSIMSKGRLKCAGSSLFLKSRLGVGYTLAIACEQGVNTASLSASVQKHVPPAKVLSAAGGELTMQLPVAAVPSFPNLLSMLETDGSRLGVRSHGISLTTLEEVFLKIGHDEDDAGAEGDTALPPVQPGVQPEAEAAVVAVGSANKDAWKDAAKHCDQGTWWTQPRALLMKRFHNAKRDRRTQVLQIILPVVCICLALLLALLSFGSGPDLPLLPAEFASPTEISLSTACPAAFAQNRYPGSDLNPGVPATATNATGLSAYLLQSAKAHEKDRLVGIACGGVADQARPTVLNNETGWPHSLPLALQTHAAMSIRAAAGRDVAVLASVHPLPRTHHEGELTDSFRSLMMGVIIMIPFSFIPSTFVAFIVKERECKAKHLQTVCGLHYITYWLCNFVFDLACFLITTTLALLIFLIFRRDEYVGDFETFCATALLFSLYGVAGVSGSYLVSFLFDSHATAQNVAMMANFIMGFVLVLAAWFLSLIDSTKSVGDVVVFIFRMWPSFCLGNGILNLASGGLLLGGDPGPWDMKMTGWNMIFLAVEAPLFLALTLLIDHPSLLKSVQTFAHAEMKPELIEDEDPDVAQERHEVEGNRRDTDLIVVKNLRKMYKTHLGTKLAVKNLSFAVAPGEVFGFLGTNGAGKTTSMSMLCGEFLPTSGQGVIAGKDVVTQAGEVRKLLGYCPQFDALLELLTVEEHMELYAGLRGMCGEAKTAIVEGLIEHCGLGPHRAKQTRSLSGGNKRKLSVALALIGGPKVVFLDEPSAGMDPMARRGLWDVLEEVAKHCCIVLTTHHLEEVEALATRVAIMDQGQMKCLGSLQHLKAKFGSGFEMSLRASAEMHVAPLRDFVSANIARAELQEERSGKLTYALPQSTKLSLVFSLLEQHKERLNVTDYSISQTSLESVFLKISEQGKEGEEGSPANGLALPGNSSAQGHLKHIRLGGLEADSGQDSDLATPLREEHAARAHYGSAAGAVAYEPAQQARPRSDSFL